MDGTDNIDESEFRTRFSALSQILEALKVEMRPEEDLDPDVKAFTDLLLQVAAERKG